MEDKLNPGDVIRFQLGGFQADWLVTRYDIDTGWITENGPTARIELRVCPPGERDVKTITLLGPDTPAAALARAVLSGSTGAVPALLDAAMESYRLESVVNLEAEADRLAAEVRANGPKFYMDGSGYNRQLLPDPEPLLRKLESLGYGKAVRAYREMLPGSDSPGVYNYAAAINTAAIYAHDWTGPLPPAGAGR